MSGFVGVCGIEITDSIEGINNATKVLSYSQNSSFKNLNNDASFILNKSTTVLGLRDKELMLNNISIWLDGEVYNETELEIGDKKFLNVLFDHYQAGTLKEFLKKVDGVFNLIIYDLNKRILHLITDRNGLKFIYLNKNSSRLILAPELKCFPYFSSFNLSIRKDVVDSFIQLEHFIGNNTWFDGVVLAEPSSIYTYAWEINSLTNEYYWTWSQIKPSSLTISDSAMEMVTLLEHAVNKRSSGDLKIGIGLSGGYDSRAILAAISKQKPQTYTFGIERSSDVQIAKKVAQVAGVTNKHFDIHTEHWLKERFTGVWKTDGMLNMYHMHYSHLMPQIKNMIDANLSGYLGDVVLGGSYLTKKAKTYLNQRINKSIAAHYYGKYHELSDVNNSYFDIDKIDPYLIYNRGRRMIGLGMEEANKTILQRMPFMDCKLLDFAYSLSDEFRNDGKVYHLGLLLKYSKLFGEIPNATTGVTIQQNPTLYQKSKKRINRLIALAKYNMGITTSYTDVANWIKRGEPAQFIGELLSNKGALYRNYTSEDFYEEYFLSHLRGKRNFSKQVMGAVTFEIWLQQILNKKYL